MRTIKQDSKPVRTIKGPCFDECRKGIQEVHSPGFLDFYMECGCTDEGVTVPTPKLNERLPECIAAEEAGK